MTSDSRNIEHMAHSRSADCYQHMTSRQKGFTLIEVMIVVIILAILAAIAVPSYRHYVVVNAERDTQAAMSQLQIELERWRASALTYKGFVPKKIDGSGNKTYGYANTDNTIINVPEGSGDDYTYRITLVDGDTSGAASSLVSTGGVDNITGRSWKMLAVPNPNRYAKFGNKILLTSAGVRCMTTTTLTIGLNDCGTNAEVW